MVYPTMDGHKSSNESSGLINPVNIRDEVYNLLRRRILAHEYPAGYRFNLPELEKQLGVSRTPIKEALHRLEAERLVEIRPRRGTFVINIDPRDIAESFDIRRVLEIYAAEIAVEKATEAELSELRRLFDEMSRLCEAEDCQPVIAEHIAIDHQFHSLIVSLSQNKRLQEIYENIELSVQLVRMQERFTPTDIKQANAEHKKIMRAFEQGDHQSLKKAISDHLEQSKVRTLATLEQHPD